MKISNSVVNPKNTTFFSRYAKCMQKLPDSFLVVHQCFIEFSLLLQNGGQIGMSRCKLRKHFQSFQIQGGGLFNEALFPLDVGQVIKGIRMVGTQPKVAKSWLKNLIDL